MTDHTDDGDKSRQGTGLFVHDGLQAGVLLLAIVTHCRTLPVHVSDREIQVVAQSRSGAGTRHLGRPA